MSVRDLPMIHAWRRERFVHTHIKFPFECLMSRGRVWRARPWMQRKGSGSLRQSLWHTTVTATAPATQLTHAKRLRTGDSEARKNNDIYNNNRRAHWKRYRDRRKSDGEHDVRWSVVGSISRGEGWVGGEEKRMSVCVVYVVERHLV